MLTGVVFHPGAVASEKPLPEDGAFPISVSIQIPDPLPDPLPVKRYPEPDVRSVDVVSPTEELRAYVRLTAIFCVSLQFLRLFLHIYVLLSGFAAV